MDRAKDFKNYGETVETLRQKHNEVTVNLRKIKRNEILDQQRSVLQMADGNRVNTEHITEVVNKIKPDTDSVSLHSYICDLIMFLKDTNDKIEDKTQFLIDAGLLPKLVPLLGHKEDQIRAISLHVLGNIAAGSDNQALELLNCNTLIYLEFFLAHPDVEVRADALWFLLNATFRHESEVEAVFQSGLLPAIIRNLMGDNLIIQIKAAWVINNLARNGNEKHVRILIDEHAESIVPSLCGLLVHRDNELIFVILFVLYKMLPLDEHIFKIISDCEGFKQIERLSDHGNEDIEALAHDILID